FFRSGVGQQMRAEVDITAGAYLALEPRLGVTDAPGIGIELLAHPGGGAVQRGDAQQAAAAVEDAPPEGLRGGAVGAHRWTCSLRASRTTTKAARTAVWPQRGQRQRAVPCGLQLRPRSSCSNRPAATTAPQLGQRRKRHAPRRPAVVS